MIEVLHVSKYYGPFVAVRDVSFDIRRGEVVTMLGPNGAGKTTIMKVLSGFIGPSAGCAMIAGIDVQANRVGAAARVGYLPENGPLYSDMTPQQLLRFSGEVRGLSKPTREARLTTVLAQCQIEHVAGKTIGGLSKGLRQRVGLAQALLHDPDVLILDEPASGLDPNQARQYRSMVRQLARTKAILISTHILQEVEAIADRVLVIHRGRLVFDGTPSDMATEAPLQEAFYRLTDGTAAS